MARILSSVVPDEIVECLASSGLAWEMVPGKNHDKLLIEGRLCQVFTRSRAQPKLKNRATLNKIANVRRVVRRILDERSPQR